VTKGETRLERCSSEESVNSCAKKVSEKRIQKTPWVFLKRQQPLSKDGCVVGSGGEAERINRLHKGRKVFGVGFGGEEGEGEEKGGAIIKKRTKLGIQKSKE